MKNISKKNWVLYIVTFLVIVIGDQLTKILVSSSMMLGQSQAIIDNFFYYTYSHNQGAAWGMLSGHISLFVVVSLAAAIFMFYYFSKTTKAQKINTLWNCFNFCRSCWKSNRSSLFWICEILLILLFLVMIFLFLILLIWQ